MSARRAIARWAWRLLRRDWRQQVLVVALLVVAVAAAIGFATAAFNTVGVPDAATYGNAHHQYVVESPDPTEVRAARTAATRRFGPVDVVARWDAPIPGSVDSVEVRSADPGGAHARPILDVLDGRAPRAADEVALTDRIADALSLAAGDVFDLDDTARTVVGIVENPRDLADEFALVAPDQLDDAESVTLLVGGEGTFAEVRELRRFGAEHLAGADVNTRSGDAGAEVRAAAGVLGTVAVALVLVGLVAAAGFVTIAHRRLRQLGMLGAVGATERHLRLVMVANGVAVGAVAVGAGVALGLVGWFVAAPRLEASAGFRIDVTNVPWWIVLAAGALAMTSAVGAAWWPARAVARMPTTRALSGRPLEQQPAVSSVWRAALLLAIGVTCLVRANEANALLLVVGTVATVVGALLTSPLLVRAFGMAARWLPVAPRLALRDLARHAARSGVALAAVSLALGIPVAIVVAATVAEAAQGRGNVAEHQLLVWTRDPSAPEGMSPMFSQDPSDEGFSPYLPVLDERDLRAMGAAVDDLAASLGSSVVPLDLVVDPALGERAAVTLARRTEIGYLDVAPLYLATPALVGRYGVEGAIEGILTVPTADRLPSFAQGQLLDDEIFLANLGAGPTPVGAVTELDDRHTSIPGSFVAPATASARGWETARVGWLLESDAPLTADDVVAARGVAADAGLLIESRDPATDLTALRWGATATGVAIALGVLAMTVGLLRTEGGRDLRTLTATGAASGVRRTLTAATAGGVALLGALLGTAGAYVALGAGYVGLPPVPLGPLAVVILGVPIAALLAGWLAAGREPGGIARRELE